MQDDVAQDDPKSGIYRSAAKAILCDDCWLTAKDFEAYESSSDYGEAQPPGSIYRAIDLSPTEAHPRVF